MDFIKIKKCCSLKNTDKKLKRQATEWEKIYPNHVSDKGLVYRIYKKLSNQTTQLKMGKTSEQTLHQRRDMMANKHMKKCSVSLIIRKMQIKAQ